MNGFSKVPYFNSQQEKAATEILKAMLKELKNDDGNS
jgi:hypothetical protein